MTVRLTPKQEAERRIKEFHKGRREGVKLYAWWKDSIQYVGTTGTTLVEALGEINKDEKEELSSLTVDGY